MIAIACYADAPPLAAASQSAELRPPAIVAPAPREISFGRVSGKVGDSVARVHVRVDGELVRTKAPSSNGSYVFIVRLPPRDVTIRVVAEDADGNRASRVVKPVYGLPRAGRPIARRLPVEDATLARRVRRLARDYRGIAAVYVQDLQTRRGAAWNAAARFPAASTVKLAIALEVLRRRRLRPAQGSFLSRQLWRMLVHSNNEAANALLTWIGGSTSAGAARVNATLRALGVNRTHLYGGYLVPAATTRPIPIRVEEQPSFGVGKHTTAYDLAKLHRYVHLASGHRGALIGLRGRFTAKDARFLLWMLAHVTDRGKIDRFLADSVSVLHKAGWISTARHDAGLVYWRGGSYVVAVMTWRQSGVGTSSDILAGRVAATAIQRFRQLSRAAGTTAADGSFTLTA